MVKQKKYFIVALLLATSLLSGCRKNEHTLFNLFGNGKTETSVVTEEVIPSEIPVSEETEKKEEPESSEKNEPDDVVSELVSEENSSVETTVPVSETASQEIPIITEAAVLANTLENVDDYVRVIADANGYISPSDKSQVLAILSKDLLLHRQGISSNGFSLVVADNGIYYYIDNNSIEVIADEKTETTTEEMITENNSNELLYFETNDKIWLSSDSIAVYIEPIDGSEPYGYIAGNQQCDRIGYFENGWTAISTDAGVLYISSDVYIVQ